MNGSAAFAESNDELKCKPVRASKADERFRLSAQIKQLFSALHRRTIVPDAQNKPSRAKTFMRQKIVIKKRNAFQAFLF
ncbi:MAG TPA: hypothetical protein H9670_06195 [Firmicutes bacterium]|nr:hypothetical protein [Bacillota bacterium]